jgi:hypothetical protein
MSRNGKYKVFRPFRNFDIVQSSAFRLRIRYHGWKLKLELALPESICNPDDYACRAPEEHHVYSLEF